MKKIECPSCAMEVDSDSKECPICGYEFTRTSKWMQVVAILLILLILYFWIL